MSGRDGKGRFKDGHQSMSRGRPSKSVADVPASPFEFLLDLALDDGAMKELDVADQIEMGIYRRAIEGNRRAQRTVLGWIRRRADWYDSRRETTPKTFLESEAVEPTDCFKALRALGVSVPDERLREDEILRELDVSDQLLPWAVQEAISRPGSKDLSKDDIASIESATVHPETLRWPRGLKTIR